MENKKIRLAVLGNGPRGMGLAGVYATHPNVEVVAVCDIADDYANNTANHIQNMVGYTPKAFKRYEDLAKGSERSSVETQTLARSESRLAM